MSTATRPTWEKGDDRGVGGSSCQSSLPSTQGRWRRLVAKRNSGKGFALASIYAIQSASFLLLAGLVEGSFGMNATFIVFVCGLLAVQAEPLKDEGHADRETPAPILIDWIHANDLSMVGLRPGIYDYHATVGFRHGFDFLVSRGVEHEYVSEGRLNPERLAKHKLLFINLPSAEREPFLVSEVMAIRDFVKNGGSLLVVMDHSNCYFHSHRLKPLLAVLGIEAFVDTVCDGPPHTIGGGKGWLAITQFSRHPVTTGLQRLGYQTGGRLDPRYSVAWTSSSSWADEWKVGIYGEDGSMGLYGDFCKEEHEVLGPHGVVLAREFQKGRIVVVGDQNMWGDAYMNYADNYRLWLNTMAWLLRDGKLADWKGYESWHSPRAVFYEPRDKARFGSNNVCDYYYLLCLVARHYWTFANDRLDESADLRIVADGGREFSAEEVARFNAYVREGGKLVVVPHVAGESDLEEEVTEPLVGLLDLSGSEKTSTEHSTEYMFGNGGRVVLLAEELAPNCGRLAPPIRVPNAEEGERAEVVLGVVRGLLGE